MDLGRVTNLEITWQTMRIVILQFTTIFLLDGRITSWG